MSNGYAKTVLMDRIISDIKALEKDGPKEGEPECSTREPVKRGLTTLLEVKLAEMKDDRAARNSIKFGNITVTGSVAVISVLVLYIVLKINSIV